jgi:hypothetical protein
MSINKHLYNLEEVENWIMECDSIGIVPDMAKQLADTMRENEMLIETLQECYEQLWHLAKDPDTNWLVKKVKNMLASKQAFSCRKRMDNDARNANVRD